MQAGEMKNSVGAMPARARAWFGRLDAPVLVQEMRVRQRGMKPFVVMLAYLLILSICTMLMIFFMMPEQRSDSRQMSEMGQWIYAALTFLQLVMVVLIVPAYSSGAVSGERERGTFDLLALTLLSSSSIVTQKLAAAVGQVVMLILTSLPVMSVVFLLGGVSPIEVIVAYLVLLVTAIALGALGMLCSCCLRSSKAATFAAYLIIILFMAGLPIGGAWLLDMARAQQSILSDRAFPWTFAAMYLFVGGVLSLMIYAPLAVVMHGKTNIWRVRAFRMSIFGAVYALLLLALSGPSTTDMVVNSCYAQGMFLPLFVNPFVALFSFMDAQFGGYSGRLGLAWGMIGATAAFSLGCAYLFRHISSARFAGLRRS
jgi:ABC-type transport system involved in multi-copper enzyme maturation permease subunit